MNDVTYIPNWIGKFNKVEIFLVVNEKSKKIKILELYHIPLNINL
jgi:hypothetical protein